MHVRISQYPWWKVVLDGLTRPTMHIAMFPYLWESPQETRSWNNRDLTDREIAAIATYRMVEARGDYSSRRDHIRVTLARIHPLSHLPGLGWNQYIVLAPTDTDIKKWHLGWYVPGKRWGKVSTIIVERPKGYGRVRHRLQPVQPQVRSLLGPEPVLFFGVDEDGYQIRLREVDRSSFGDPRYRHIPLR